MNKVVRKELRVQIGANREGQILAPGDPFTCAVQPLLPTMTAARRASIAGKPLCLIQSAAAAVSFSELGRGGEGRGEEGRAECIHCVASRRGCGGAWPWQWEPRSQRVGAGEPTRVAVHSTGGTQYFSLTAGLLGEMARTGSRGEQAELIRPSWLHS